MKIFWDGGWRPASGMEIALVVGGRTEIRQNLGEGDSMAAEWLALVAAMRLAQELALADAVLLGDAAAVIAQANGAVRVPPAFRDYAETFAAMPRPPGRVRLRTIGRAQNLAGIALARLRR